MIFIQRLTILWILMLCHGMGMCMGKRESEWQCPNALLPRKIEFKPRQVHSCRKAEMDRYSNGLMCLDILCR